MDEDRRATAAARRRLIIDVMERLADPGARHAGRLQQALDEGHDLVVGADIDGLVSSMMLAAVGSCRVTALALSSDRFLVHPEWTIPEGGDWPTVYGVDTFSLCCAGVSNHPMHLGPYASGPFRELTADWDETVTERTDALGTINLSVWAGIQGRGATSSPRGMAYKYPLGTAQLVLAALEVVGRRPRLYDRRFLPWLIANCDGGLDSIRNYAWNVEGWWSGLAAVAGPASATERIYELALNQRATEFVDLDRRLRYEVDGARSLLDERWNVAGESIGRLQGAIDLLRGLTGWPSPLRPSPGGLADWRLVAATSGRLPLQGMTTRDPHLVQAQLAAAATAAHANVSSYDGEVRLVWRSLPQGEGDQTTAPAPAGP